MNEDQKDLKRSLTLMDVFCLSTGAMISAGIFLLPGEAFSHLGPAIIFSYLLGGVIATLGTLTALELATAMPQAGGVYYFTTRSLGPLAGTVSGVLDWASLALKSAFAIYGTAQIINQFLPTVNTVLLGIAITLFFLVANLLSTATAAFLQRIMVVLLVAIMLAYIVLGADHMDAAGFAPFFFDGKGWKDIFVESGFIFISFGGILGVINVAEEVKNPRKNLPQGILLSLLVVTVLYVLVMAMTVGVIPADKLVGSKTPLADVAQLHYGRAGFLVMTVGALLAFVTTGNSGIMGAARYPMALARDNLMPTVFAKVMGRREIPLPALLLTGGTMCLAQLLPLELLVAVSSTVVMLSYILTNMSVMILRESGVLNYRPSFRTPFYPVLPVICILLFSLLIIRLGNSAVNTAYAIIFASMLLYFIHGRNVRKETAFMHLIRRLTNSDGEALGTHELEGELREVVRKRDNMVYDDMDAAIEQSRAIIVKGPLTLDEFFGKVCDEIGSSLDIPPDKIAKMLLERETQSSTVISPGVAVPHATVADKSDLFEIVLVKADDGIVFGQDYAPVNTIVLMFCSRENRTQYLRGLAMIAQTILSRNFDTRWEKARTPEQLKDIFLLSHRSRPKPDEET